MWQVVTNVKFRWYTGWCIVILIALLCNIWLLNAVKVVRAKVLAVTVTVTVTVTTVVYCNDT